MTGSPNTVSFLSPRAHSDISIEIKTPLSLHLLSCSPSRPPHVQELFNSSADALSVRGISSQNKIRQRELITARGPGGRNQRAERLPVSAEIFLHMTGQHAAAEGPGPLTACLLR